MVRNAATTLTVGFFSWTSRASQLLRMVDSGLLQSVGGVISTGKEASVYRGVLRWSVAHVPSLGH